MSRSQTKQQKDPITVCVTGAAGQIGYAVIFLIARGQMLGEDQPIKLHLLDIQPCMGMLHGVVMELEDGAYPLITSVVATADYETAFKNIDIALLIGARPRGPGMLRKDLLLANMSIFEGQGIALDKWAKKTVKVLVVGNPANTNAYIASKNAPSLPTSAFSALTRLDQNRAKAQIAKHLKKKVSTIKKVAIWGNHSSTQYPDLHNAVVVDPDNNSLKPVFDKTSTEDIAWMKSEFIPTVQKRGAAVIQARKKSSAASAAHAIISHVKDWVLGTPEGDFSSMGIISDGTFKIGNEIIIPKGLVYSFPCVCRDGVATPVELKEIDEFSKQMMLTSLKELKEEREAVDPSDAPITVCVTGAAGQIGYALIFMIAQGSMLGRDQPIKLHLLDIPPCLGLLNGVVMELEDGAFPLVTSVVATADYETAFKDIDIALLVGARPRGPGMLRKDLLRANAPIFEGQGLALDKWAKKTVKILVVGNPANTNAYIVSKNAPSLPRSAFSALTRLDQNRAKAQISKRLKKPVSSIKKVAIWGNHSSTQYPDLHHAVVVDPGTDNEQPVLNKDSDDDWEWMKTNFIPTVQKRGATVIKARKKSSAASAANAIIKHVADWVNGTPDGDFSSMGIISDGTYKIRGQTIPKGLVFSFPCVCKNGVATPVTNLKLSNYSEKMMLISLKELQEEREAVDPSPKKPISVCVTGAAGQIGYAVTFLIARGEMLGYDQPIKLHLLDIPPCMGMLNGVVMELEDGAYPLITSVVATADYETAFKNIDIALLIGARPRGPGMLRKDLLLANMSIFKGQGAALDKWAKKTVKVLVVGNPANTNAYIASKNAPSLPKSAWSALTRLDQNRAKAQISKHLKVPVSNIKKVAIWGNHSSTQYPDLHHAVVVDPKAKSDGPQPIFKGSGMDEWMKTDFIPTVQKRGAAVIAARKKSSAASAAHAIISHVADWVLGTPAGDFSSMGIISDGTYTIGDMTIPEGLVFSFPCVCKGGVATPVHTELKINEFSQKMMLTSLNELMEEKEAVDPSPKPVTVCVTGAAGQIGYAVIFMIANGCMLGDDQPIKLHLLDIPQCLDGLNGVVMELEDGAYPLVTSVVATADYETAFKDIDIALLIGARPRGPGMLRKDLLLANMSIFEGQGAALDKWAKKTVKVLVVGNPANTNAYIASKNAPSLPKSAFSALTRLDQNRAKAQIAKRLKLSSTKFIKRVAIWGNHSSTQYPDLHHAVVIDANGTPKPVFDGNSGEDWEWMKTEFVPTVQKRGAAVIKARQKSSAASAANAIVSHIADWVNGTPAGDFSSMGVVSDGTYKIGAMAIPEGLVYSVPCVCAGGIATPVTKLKFSDFSKKMMLASLKELQEEKKTVDSVTK